ncbi:hypothetical protein LEMLEM_LOCUS16817 [Lemmus lemmus]
MFYVGERDSLLFPSKLLKSLFEKEKSLDKEKEQLIHKIDNPTGIWKSYKCHSMVLFLSL